MKRLLILPAVAIVCTLEAYRRGFVAPLLFGLRGHARSVAFWEPDQIG